MKEKMCCFDGDRIKYGEKETEKIRLVLTQIIEKDGVRNFCFLRKSALDKTAISILNEQKDRYPDILIGVVMPNIDRDRFNFNQKPYSEYDFFLTDTIARKAPDGWETKSWNYYMIDCSTHLICDSAKGTGRARATLAYAESKGDIKIFNIAEN